MEGEVVDGHAGDCTEERPCSIGRGSPRLSRRGSGGGGMVPRSGPARSNAVALAFPGGVRVVSIKG